MPILTLSSMHEMSEISCTNFHVVAETLLKMFCNIIEYFGSNKVFTHLQCLDASLVTIQDVLYKYWSLIMRNNVYKKNSMDTNLVKVHAILEVSRLGIVS